MACCLSVGVAVAAPSAPSTKPAATAKKPAAPAAKPAVVIPKMAPILTGVAPPEVAARLPNYSKDDPVKVAAARAFLIAYRPNLDPVKSWAMIDKMMPRMIAGQQKLDPKFDPVKYDRDNRIHLMHRILGSLDLQAHVVSRHFSLQELKDLQAFFVGPLGRKLIDQTPVIKREMRLIRSPVANMDEESDGAAVKASPAPKKK